MAPTERRTPRRPVVTPAPPFATNQPLLIYLPGVGGGARDMADWASQLTNVNAVCVARRPGAPQLQSRDELRSMAEHVAYAVLANQLPSRMAIVGHSFGAVLGFEVARLIERERPGVLCHLVAAAQVAPQCLPRMGPAGLTDDAVLRRMTGTDRPPVELAGVPDLVEALLPQWKAEYRALEEYQYDEVARVAVNISVWTGRQDISTADNAGIWPWTSCTTGATSFRSFEGGHDFLRRFPATTARSLSALITGRAGRQPSKEKAT